MPKKRVVSVGYETREERPSMPCCFDGCSMNAYLAVKQPQGIANVCRTHYEHLATLAAKRWCEARGLTTLARQRAFVAGKGFRIREPGEDETEAA